MLELNMYSNSNWSILEISYWGVVVILTIYARLPVGWIHKAGKPELRAFCKQVSRFRSLFTFSGNVR